MGLGWALLPNDVHLRIGHFIDPFMQKFMLLNLFNDTFNENALVETLNILNGERVHR